MAPNAAPRTLVTAMKSERTAYRIENDHALIEIRLHTVRQLFHTLDPAPFNEKDLDDNAAEYIEQACHEAGRRSRVRLVVHLPAEEAQGESARTLPESIHNYFAYREIQLGKEIARLMRYGATSLAIGLVFLIACIVLRQTLDAHPTFVDQSIVDEGLLILGWVAMWRPIEVLLYDWWPIARRRKVMRRLAAIAVEVRTS